MIHKSKLIEIDKSSSLSYAQHIQINIKNLHVQQLDMTSRVVQKKLFSVKFCSKGLKRCVLVQK